METAVGSRYVQKSLNTLGITFGQTTETKDYGWISNFQQIRRTVAKGTDFIKEPLSNSICKIDIKG